MSPHEEQILRELKEDLYQYKTSELEEWKQWLARENKNELRENIIIILTAEITERGKRK